MNTVKDFNLTEAQALRLSELAKTAELHNGRTAWTPVNADEHNDASALLRKGLLKVYSAGYELTPKGREVSNASH